MQVAKVEVTYGSPRPFETPSASCTIVVLAADGESVSEAARLSAMQDAKATVAFALSGKTVAAPTTATAPVADSPTKPPRTKKADATPATATAQTTAPSVAAALDGEAAPSSKPSVSEPEITADDIKKLIPQKVKELGGDEAAASRLREVVAKFKPANWAADVAFKSGDLPAERRAEFVAAVKALTKGGATKDDI